MVVNYFKSIRGETEGIFSYTLDIFRMLGFDSPGWCRWPASSASEENPLSCPDSKSPPDNPGQTQSRSGLCLFSDH